MKKTQFQTTVHTENIIRQTIPSNYKLQVKSELWKCRSADVVIGNTVIKV